MYCFMADICIAGSPSAGRDSSCSCSFSYLAGNDCGLPDGSAQAGRKK